MGIIEVKNLSFAYDESAKTIDEVSFSIEEGTYTTIIGHNGSGKSTIAKLIAGLLEKASGSIMVDGMELNVENLNKIRSNIGIVFQNPDNQFIGSTVRDDIAFGLENHCVPQEDMDQIIEENAALVGMTRYLNQEPTRLSGGQKQRLTIARALLKNPEILIMDDSASALDFATDLKLRRAIHNLGNQMTVFIVSQRASTVRAANQILVLDDGNLVGKGTHDELMENCQVYQEIYYSQFPEEKPKEVMA